MTSGKTEKHNEDHLRQGSRVSPTTSAIAGSISGLVARTCTAPLDVVKIKLQLQVDGNKYQGIIHTMKVVVKEQGLIGLWRGNVPAATMYVIYGAIQFSSYSYYNTLLSDLEEYNNLKVPPSIHSLILGSMAGCTGSLVSYPFDLLRTRFVSNSKISSIVGTIRSINKTEGFHAFFKGLNAGLVSISVYSGLMFWSYETSMMIFQRLEFDSYPILSNFVEPACGFVAGFTAKTIVFPLDLIRKRLQINTGRNMNFISAGFKVIRHEGPKGLYKGFLASVIKSAPTTAISLWTYEFVLRTSESMKKVLR